MKTGKLSSRGLLWALMGIVTAAILVASFLVPGAQGALSAQLRNASNTAGARYRTCAQAIAATPGLIAGYQLTKTGDNTNLGTQGGVARARKATLSAGTANIGCKADSPQTSMSFNGKTGTGVDGANGTRAWTVSDLTGPVTYSEEVWFRTTTKQGVIMGFANVEDYRSEANYNRMIWINPNGQLVAGTAKPGNPSTFTTVTSPGAVSDNQWHHVIVTRDAMAKTFILYLDGTRAASATTVDDPPEITGHWRVGCMKMDSWPDNGGQSKECFLGTMQFFAAYNRPLSAAEVKDHYVAGRAWGP